jgi:hypothetical protein
MNQALYAHMNNKRKMKKKKIKKNKYQKKKKKNKVFQPQMFPRVKTLGA